MLNNLIWDFDGTLYDTYPVMVRAYLATLADFGLTKVKKDELYRLLKFKSARFATAYFVKLYGLEAAAFTDRYHHYEERWQQKPAVYPGAVDVLTKVVQKKGLNLLETHRDQRAQTFLEQDNLAQYFAGGVTASDAYPRKPDPSALLALVDRYQLDPQHTAMVGDRRLDVEAGVNAKLKTIYFNVDGLNDAPQATWQVNELNEILSLLD